jgi:hypothetical protein
MNDKLPPFELVCGMEDSLHATRRLVFALGLIADGLEDPEAGAVGEIARLVEDHLNGIIETRDALFHALHPNRDGSAA